MTSSNIPNPSGAHPLSPNDDQRKKRPLWLALLAGLILLALVITGIVLLATHHKKHSTAATVPTTTSTAPTSIASTDTVTTTSPTDDTSATSPDSITPASTLPVSTAPVSSAAPVNTAPAAPVAGAASLTAGAAALLPAPAGNNADLSKYVGQKANAKDVMVLLSPADNGFWIGTSAKDEVWVQLLLPGLVSPHPVRKGDHVSFPATVVANSSGFAAKAGVNAAEGAARLTAQKAHLEVAKTAITFTN